VTGNTDVVATDRQIYPRKPKGLVVDVESNTTVSTIGGFPVCVSDAGPCTFEPAERSKSFGLSSNIETEQTLVD
jgi:hypothetical protein